MLCGRVTLVKHAWIHRLRCWRWWPCQRTHVHWILRRKEGRDVASHPVNGGTADKDECRQKTCDNLCDTLQESTHTHTADTHACEHAQSHALQSCATLYARLSVCLSVSLCLCVCLSLSVSVCVCLSLSVSVRVRRLYAVFYLTILPHNYRSLSSSLAVSSLTIA